MMSEESLSAAQMLLQARLDRDWSLDQVSLQTRIPKEQIQALETSDFAALPGAPYARAFCKTLAQAYELDPDQVLAGLRHDMGLASAPSKAPRPTPGAVAVSSATPEDPSRPRSLLMVAGILLVALAILIAATRLGGLSNARSVESPGPTDKAKPVDSTFDSLEGPARSAVDSTRSVKTAKPAPVVVSTPLARISSVDSGNAVFVLYIRQGTNKLRKKTLGLGDTLVFDPDTAMYVHSLSRHPLRIGGTIRRDTLSESCFKVERKSDTVRITSISESKWQEMAESIRKLKRRREE